MRSRFANRWALVFWCTLLICKGALSGQPPVTCVAFAPQGHTVVAGSQAGVHVLQWPDLTRQRELANSVLNVHDIAFAPGGQSVAIAGGTPSEEGVVEVLRWPDGERVARFAAHDDCVLSVCWQTDNRLATASLDHQIAIWELGQKDPIERLSGHSRGVTAVRFLPGEGGRLVSAGLDQVLRVWDAATGQLLRSLNNHSAPIHGLAVAPGSQMLPLIASVSDDRSVRFWQPTIGRMVRFTRLEETPLAVAWLPDASRVVTAWSDGHVRWVDPQTSDVTGDTPAVTGWAYCLAVHPQDGAIVVGGTGGQIIRVSSDTRE